METLSHLLEGLGSLMGPIPLLVIAAGVVVGILGGAMPGISPSMAVALLLPITYSMSATHALLLELHHAGVIDGFRIDTVKHVNTEFWQQFAPDVLNHAKARGNDDFGAAAASQVGCGQLGAHAAGAESAACAASARP